MSQVYATEPSTSGRIVLETTHGPIEIQLWSQECPATTRCFLQLCLDGFYKDSLWHRIVPNFLIQTGAMRSTELQDNDDDSTKKQRNQLVSSYRQAIQAQAALERRQYELHSRLLFRRRGIVAMALGVQEDEDELEDDTTATRNSGNSSEQRGWMQPQFFITLEEAPYLNGKHVIFGSVSGPTIFNVVRIATKTHVNEETSLPVDLDHAPRILSVKIVENPFPDLQAITTIKKNLVLPWMFVAKTGGDHQTTTAKKRKRKGVKNINVLSFGAELEEEPTAPFGGIKSRHDVEGTATSKVKRSEQQDKEDKPALARLIRNPTDDSHATINQSDEDSKLEANYGDDINETVKQQSLEPEQEHPELFTSASRETIPQKAQAPEESNTRTGDASSIQQDFESNRSQRSSSSAPKISAVEARKLKYAQKSYTPTGSKKKREEDTMSKLLAFKSNLLKQVSHADSSTSNNDEAVDNSLAARMARRALAEQKNNLASRDNNDEKTAPTYRGQILDVSDDESERKNDWLKTKFKCRKHMDLDSTRGAGDGGDEVAGDGRYMDDYEVVDAKGEGNKHRHTHSRHRHNHKRDRQGRK